MRAARVSPAGEPPYEVIEHLAPSPNSGDPPGDSILLAEANIQTDQPARAARLVERIA